MISTIKNKQIGLFWILPYDYIVSHVIDANKSSGGHKNYWQTLIDKKDSITSQVDWKHYLRGRLIHDNNDTFRLVTDLDRLTDKEAELVAKEFKTSMSIISLIHNEHYTENPPKKPSLPKLRNSVRPI